MPRESKGNWPIDEERNYINKDWLNVSLFFKVFFWISPLVTDSKARYPILWLWSSMALSRSPLVID